jgi:hypothetical protein
MAWTLAEFYENLPVGLEVSSGGQAEGQTDRQTGDLISLPSIFKGKYVKKDKLYIIFLFSLSLNS